MEETGGTPAVGEDIIEMAHGLVETAECKWVISKQGVQATVISKNTIEAADPFIKTADTKRIEGKCTGILQRIKSSMHGNDFRLVEQATKSLLQAGSSGSPGGKQVGSLAAGSHAEALGDLTKQHFHGAGHVKC